MHAGPEDAGLSASQNQDRDKLCEIMAEFVRPLKRRWTIRMNQLQDKIATLKEEMRRLEKLGARMLASPDQQISLSSILSVRRFILARVKLRSSETHHERPDGSAELIPPPQLADRPAEASGPLGPAPQRREDAATLISKTNHAASDRATLAPDLKPGQFDRRGQRRRLNLWVPGSDLRRTEKRPNRPARPESRYRSIEPEPELPKFAPVSLGIAPRDQLSSGTGGPAVRSELWEAFTPSRPKYSSRFLAGRRWALQRIVTAVEQDQTHIVIFGSRGIGKTSLANVLAESASEAEYQILRYPCGSNATFEEIFRGLLRSLPADHLGRATQAKIGSVKNFEQLLPEGKFGPTDLTAILSQIKLDHAILIIDEFDRVKSKKLKNQLAEAIKNLSDASARVTFIVIGIAHSLEELIGMHPSIQRHLVGIHLPLMTASELERVVLAGEDASGVRFEDATRDMIVTFSKGLPYYAQLLSLHAGRMALKRGSMLVQMADLRDALEMVLVESDPLARASYETATRDETDQLLIDVLFAAATAPFDDYGTFTAESAVEMLVDSKGKKLPEAEIRQTLENFARQKKSRLIETWPMPTAETRYAFVLQTMRPYILLRQALCRGLM
jgi:Cdc6-like AAA superfamily ATPase